MAEYLEREQAIQKVKNVMATEWFRGNFAAIGPLQRVIDVQLGRMTAADVAPVVHGRWIRFKEHDSCYVHMRCSECSAYWSDPSHADSFRYCPNCGAKMDGEETHDR